MTAEHKQYLIDALIDFIDNQMFDELFHDICYFIGYNFYITRDTRIYEKFKEFGFPDYEINGKHILISKNKKDVLSYLKAVKIIE